jgi:hypothetical protein
VTRWPAVVGLALLLVSGPCLSQQPDVVDLPEVLDVLPGEPGLEPEVVEIPFVCDPSVPPLPNLGLVEEPGSGGCPDGMVAVTDFCVDRYEAFVVEVLPDGSEAPWSPYLNPGTLPLRAKSAAGAVPQGYISQVQAARACAEAGKRLCRDDEWLRACRGEADNVYPYGNERRSGVCNGERSRHPAIELYETTDEWIWSALGNSCINQVADGLALTGDHPGCVTDDGAYDLMGNLHEWTADPAGTFLGGYYVDTRGNGEGCKYHSRAHDVRYWDYSTGFRCCADR